MFLALGVLGGAALAASGPLRRPDFPRLARALAGGVLMGFGANMAHGCNIGLGLASIPTLSLGSLLAVAFMALGALAVRRLVLEPLPALRGKGSQGKQGDRETSSESGLRAARFAFWTGRLTSDPDLRQRAL